MNLPSAETSSSSPLQGERQRTSHRRRNRLPPGSLGPRIRNLFSQNFLEEIQVSLRLTRPPVKSGNSIKAANPSPRGFGDRTFRSLPMAKLLPLKSALL